ncbi:hypothetical protein JKP88DRAFT_229609, partial [Tribonema minus]
RRRSPPPSPLLQSPPLNPPMSRLLSPLPSPPLSQRPSPPPSLLPSRLQNRLPSRLLQSRPLCPRPYRQLRYVRTLIVVHACSVDRPPSQQRLLPGSPLLPPSRHGTEAEREPHVPPDTGNSPRWQRLARARCGSPCCLAHAPPPPPPTHTHLLQHCAGAVLRAAAPQQQQQQQQRSR